MSATLPLSMPVMRALAKLGHDVALARRRRRLTQASLAERAGMARKTLTRLEKGDPKVALEYLGRVLHILGEVDRLGQLLDTGTDQAGLLMMDEDLPQRVRARRSTGAW